MSWQSDAAAAARHAGVDPGLYVALIRQESGGNANARSPSGALGYAQLMPATARSLGVDPLNPRQNLAGGAKYLRQQLNAFGGDPRKALAAYNAGPGAVQKYGGVPPYAETQNYVKSIMSAVGGKAGKVTAPARGTPSTSAPASPIVVPGAPAAGGFDPGGGADGSAVLAQLLQRPQRAAQSTPLQAPSFAAGPTLAGAVPSSSGGPAPRADISALISASQTPGGSLPASSAQEAPQVILPASGTPAKGNTKATGKAGSRVLELIYNDGGKGYGIKNGQAVDAASVYSSVWAGHKDHVHVAAGPKTVVALGRLAQDMGLHVSENPSFGGVNPAAHVPGSYHDKAEAIDVGGSAKQLSAYARKVAAYNRTRRL